MSARAIRRTLSERVSEGVIDIGLPSDEELTFVTEPLRGVCGDSGCFGSGAGVDDAEITDAAGFTKLVVPEGKSLGISDGQSRFIVGSGVGNEGATSSPGEALLLTSFELLLTGTA